MSVSVDFSGESLLLKADRVVIVGQIEAAMRAGAKGSVSVHFVSDAEIEALNNQWRGKNSPTDVLSFSAQEGEPMPGLENILGDVVISVDTAQKQALELGHTLPEEVVVLFVHGLMHLLGHDHELGAPQAQAQAEAEMAVLQAIGMVPRLALCERT